MVEGVVVGPFPRVAGQTDSVFRVLAVRQSSTEPTIAEGAVHGTLGGVRTKDTAQSCISGATAGGPN